MEEENRKLKQLVADLGLDQENLVKRPERPHRHVTAPVWQDRPAAGQGHIVVIASPIENPLALIAGDSTMEPQLMFQERLRTLVF